MVQVDWPAKITGNSGFLGIHKAINSIYLGTSLLKENPQVKEWRMISKTLGKRCF